LSRTRKKTGSSENSAEARAVWCGEEDRRLAAIWQGKPAQTSALIGVETVIKTVVAMHSQCPLWVISDRAIPR